MALSFPNLSRSFDPEGQRVRFWAYDSAMEVSFFVNVSALLKLYPDSGRDEVAMLATFDANRDRINVAADRVHASDRQNFHILDADNF